LIQYWDDWMSQQEIGESQESQERPVKGAAWEPLTDPVIKEKR
jgi:hypothetical protein